MTAAWVKIKKDYDLRASPRTVMAYKAGNHVPVPQAHADEMVEKGVAELTNHEPQAGDTTDGKQPIRKGGKLHSVGSGQELVKQDETKDTVAVPRTKG